MTSSAFFRSQVLDYKPRFDPASLAYGVHALTGGTVRRRPVFWKPGPVLQQGQEGACVGHGWVNEATASPVRVDFTRVPMPQGWPTDPQALAFYLYEWCRKHDEWPGEDYDGTSVLTGAKGMKLLGVLLEYRWCKGVEQVIDALIALGPVVLGIPWLDGMYDAPGGELRVSGREVGGHCILAVGYDPDHLFSDGTRGEAIALFNSWGPEWGVDGIAWVRKDELAPLLAGKRGEACVPVRRSYGRTRRLTACQRARAIGRSVLAHLPRASTARFALPPAA